MHEPPFILVPVEASGAQVAEQIIKVGTFVYLEGSVEIQPDLRCLVMKQFNSGSARDSTV